MNAKETLLCEITTAIADNREDQPQSYIDSEMIKAYIKIKEYVLLIEDEKDVRNIQEVLKWSMHQHL